MNESTLDQAASQLIKQRRYKRWQMLVSVLASIVVFVTIYLLILPAITEETIVYCGYEDHIHTDSCYSCWAEYTEMNIVPPACEHIDCDLICEREEHEHTEMCYINCHTVLISMTYDYAAVIADENSAEADDENPDETADKTADENKDADNDADSTVRWERHITVRDGDTLIAYLGDIATLPNGLNAEDAVWYNAENDEEFLVTESVYSDLKLYAKFDDPPKEKDNEGLILLVGDIELYSNGYSTWAALKEAIENGVQDVALTADMIAPPGETLNISGKNVTLNMNGHTLTLSEPIQVTGWSVLTIGGQGTIQGNNLSDLISVTSSTVNLYDAVLTNPGGHGVHVKDWSTLNIYSATITNCGSHDVNGGGIAAENGSGVNMSGGTISNNTALSGGGIYLSGNSAVNMTGGTISGNNATSGGGVYFSTGISTFSGGSITENTATGNGGGIYAGDWSKADITGGVNIYSNKAGTHGGGVYADATVNADPRIALSGQAVVRDNMLIASDHDSSGCIMQSSLKSCKNIAGGAENLLSITDDAYVEGIVNTEGLSGLIAEADGVLVLDKNQKSESRIVIESDLTIDLNGYTIEYEGSGNGSTLFDVSPGVTLTIIDSSASKSGSIIANGAEALVNVEENATLNIQGGTFNNAGGQHVILVNGLGTVNLFDGVLTGATTGEWGGGICALDGMVYIYGGKITQNSVTVGGGGVCAQYLNMSGGEITYNSVVGKNARGGGGINIRKESHSEGDSDDENNFNGIITGGTISNNTSDHVGGGIFIAVGSEVYIKGTTDKVYINDNKALDKNYRYGDPLSTGHGFAGGGIFVEHPDDAKGEDSKNGGMLYVYNAVITDNTALFGGGVAGCGSSSVEVCSNDGVAVYGNTIKGVNDGGANKAAASSTDLYCDGMGKVDSMLLGNVQSGWSGRTGEGAEEETSFNTGAKTLDNFYLKCDELSADDKETVNDLASVFISGNTSGSGGGGIGGNGYIKLGLTAPTGSLTIKKKVIDAEAGDWSFDFVVTINGEEQIVTLTKDKPSYTIDELDMGTTYSVREIDVEGYTLIESGSIDGTINGNIITASFTNAVLYTLPATGGSGVTIYYILGGLILTSAALIYGYKLRYKRERRDGKTTPV